MIQKGDMFKRSNDARWYKIVFIWFHPLFVYVIAKPADGLYWWWFGTLHQIIKKKWYLTIKE